MTSWLDFFRRTAPPAGTPSGMLEVAEEERRPPRIHFISYDDKDHTECMIEQVSDIPGLLDPQRVIWIDVQGLGDEKLLRELGSFFSLHPLVIGDVMEAPQRPKVELHDQHVFLIVRTPVSKPEMEVDLEQVSVFLGKNYVLTFQERYDDLLRPVWDRILQSRGPIRQQEADYLFYDVIDEVIDSYYPLLESFGEYLEDLEDEVMHAPTQQVLHRVNRVRATLVYMRRVTWPQREALNRLTRRENPLISRPVEVYLRDCYDHCLQISEVLESYRELVAAINSTYLSAVSNRMNEIMKVLTIMASVFIPLTFIAGIYGMNFEYMPELELPYAYPAVWLVMILTAAALIFYFRRRGWIGADKENEEDSQEH